MAWVTLTETDLLSRLSGPEVEAFKNAVLDGREGDVIASALTQTVDMARGYIAASFTLGASGTIPQKLKGAVLDIAVIDAMKRAGGVIIDPGGERKAAKDDAIRLLEKVASGDFVVEEPAVADTEESGQAEPGYAGRDFEWGKEFEDGL